MSNTAAIIIDIIVFAVFGILHSTFASFKLKRIAAVRLGKYMAFYRIAYNVFFLIFLWYIFEYLPRPDKDLYDLPYPYDVITIIAQVISLFGLVWSFKYFSFHEFTGLSQIKRLFEGDYKPEELDERLTLRIRGLYKFIRHPIYLFTILFLLFRPTMDLFYLLFLIFVILYSVIGAFYEEKKLIEMFGEEYLMYKKSVPMLIPYKLFSPYKNNNY